MRLKQMDCADGVNKPRIKVAYNADDWKIIDWYSIIMST